ncbi:MAG: MBL fold metallo-hydrolase [Nitratireductor sp.]
MKSGYERSRTVVLARRQLLKAGAVLAAAGFLPGGLPRAAFASEPVALGEMKVHSLSDGNLVLPLSMLAPDTPQAEVTALLEANGFSTTGHEPPCNVTLIDTGESKILFDVGSGASFMPSAGALLESLDAISVSAEDITHVVFTHAHPDHLWGLLDEFDEPVFANATHMMGEAEHAFWTDPQTAAKMPEDRLAFFAGAKRNLDTLGDAIELFKPETEVLPGVFAIDTSGHTPGHVSFEVRSGSESLIVTGDAISHSAISFLHPDWHSGSDQDRDAGAKSRAMLLDRLANEKMMMLGYHLVGNGIGRTEKSGNAYRFVQA